MSENDFDRADAGIDAQPGQYTGRYLVLLPEGDIEGGLAALRSAAGVTSTARVSGAESAAAAQTIGDGAAIVFDEIGVAVVAAAPDRGRSLLALGTDSSPVLAVERERRVYAFGTALEDVSPAAFDETVTTWGLQVSNVPGSAFSGKGVKVAVLDTGVDPAHRDLVGRSLTTASFVPGEPVKDGHGHGTHCIGTSCGPREPRILPRYGIAYEAEIFAGKVLSNAGSGTDSGILAGMNWAIAAGCRVVSMSLGAPTQVGESYSRVYEQVARRALRRGTLIVAAAGNASHRPQDIQPVGHPANCPSIVAVAALAQDLSVAWFSCGGLNHDGGEVNIAAAGVGVRSSVPEPTGYGTKSGTSMATPHVAGIAALFAQAHPGATATQLRDLLLAGARSLPLRSRDVGAGLVQAP